MKERVPMSGRRSFLKSVVVGSVGFGVVGYGSDRVTAASSQHSEGVWSQFKADAGQSARLPAGAGPTGDIQEAWTVSHDRIHDGVAVVDQTVYVGGKTLVALNTQDGTVQWSFEPDLPDIDDPGEPLIPDVGSPAVVDGTVYANVWFGPYDGGTYDTAFIAVDADTGERRWRIDTGGASSRAFASPTVTDDTVLTTMPQGEGYGSSRMVTALGLDGTLRWQTWIEEMYSGSLPVSENRVYVPTASGVRTLDLETGSTVWTALPQVQFQPAAAPLVSDGTLFVAETADPGVTFIALDAATGNEHWRTAYAPDARYSTGIGTVDDERVYLQLGAIDDDVIALDRADGSERWRAAIDQPDTKRVPTDGVARVGDLLYVGGAAIDPTDGSTVWKHPLPVAGYGRELSAVAGGRVYVGGQGLTALTGTTE
ncbi:outer membrane protein assembly factor BamB family protein [Halocatena salina]|uniref:PQQ-binding-like beta-propeller repeat protein n=1 Tax=Halocatena salina TaxID=2934340 RepID=A0A8U0A192_9EURY|nr:PQQ-binding-like beta-propeller repeat protein [Halocatena salina]UPM41833.1 PQQ-binding-like beta-propeller repeat protein [Halocatena salina]